jgi:hypothetical protein
MPLIALPDHLALQHLQSGEQSRGAVAEFATLNWPLSIL